MTSKEKELLAKGELSDGYHTFNDLYYQRCILFATIVNTYSKLAWKSYRHENGELCFGGGWFIVGIDTPEGSYTYHYENKYWDLFNCEELVYGKHWDGHTDKDVTRLLSLINKYVKPIKRYLEILKILKEQLFIVEPENVEDYKEFNIVNYLRLQDFIKKEDYQKVKEWLDNE